MDLHGDAGFTQALSGYALPTSTARTKCKTSGLYVSQEKSWGAWTAWLPLGARLVCEQGAVLYTSLLPTQPCQELSLQIGLQRRTIIPGLPCSSGSQREAS